MIEEEKYYDDIIASGRNPQIIKNIEDQIPVQIRESDDIHNPTNGIEPISNR